MGLCFFCGSFSTDNVISQSSLKRSRNTRVLRSSPLAFLSKTLDDTTHFPATFSRINLSTTHAHVYLLVRPRVKQALQQQVAHVETDEHATVRPILLHGTVFQRHELHWRLAEQIGHLSGRKPCIRQIPGGQRVIVEGDTIHDRDEEKRPMAATFGDFRVVRVVDGKEDVRGV
jgi:hypothetical protein